MTLGLGLGLERLGLLALSRPLIFTVLALLLTIGLASFLPSLRFEGDLLKGLDRGTNAWHSAAKIQAEFSARQPDLHILVELPTDATDYSTWLESQQELVLDVRLTDGVAEVGSVFALREVHADGDTAPILDLFWQGIDQNNLKALRASHPEMALFMSEDADVTLIAVAFDPAFKTSSSKESSLFNQIRIQTEATGLNVRFAGPAAIIAENSRVLRADMMRMVVLSIIVGWIIGLLVFDTVRPVLVTNIVSPVAMLWSAGFAAATGTPIGSVSIILPLLSSIIAFADAVHIVIPLQRRVAEGRPVAAAIYRTICDIGPATVLTSLTTAVAFGSLAFAGPGLTDVALLGVVSVVLAWLAVIILCPLLCLVLAKGDFGGTRLDGLLLQRWLNRLFQLVERNFNAVTLFAVIAAIALLFASAKVPSEHFPPDYIPETSEIRQAEAQLENHFSGSLVTFVTAPRENPGEPVDETDISRLRTWQGALEKIPGIGEVWSRGRLPDEFALNLPRDAPDISKSGDAFLIAVSTEWTELGSETLARIERIKSTIVTLPGGSQAVVASPAHVIAETAITDIDQLRRALLFSVALAALIVAALARSFEAGVAIGASMLICVLAVMWLGGIARDGVSFGLVVALIISVGIAIDDGIHLSNIARLHAPTGAISEDAWREGLFRAGLPMLASSVILIATMVVTQFAEMPAIRSIGRDIMLALAIALGLTLTLVPCVAIALRRFLGNLL